MAFAGDQPILFDPASPDLTPETLPLEGILAHYVQEGHKQLRVAFPAMVMAVTADQTVDVQPLAQVRYAGRPPEAMKQILAVPVLMPQGADWRISLPLAPGDTGLCLVADRSLDAWLAGSGGVTDPLDTRTHHLADSIFVPGLVPSAKQTTDTSTDLVLGNGASMVRLQKNGHIRFSNAEQELVSVLHDTTQALIDTLGAIQSQLTLTAFGPSPLTAASIAKAANIQAQVQALLARLDTFRA